MADKPDDRLKSGTLPEDDGDSEPRIYVVVDQRKMPRPGLETFFAQADSDGAPPESGCSCDPVGVPYCSCNKVCTCVPVCACVSHKKPVCSCVGHTRSGGSYGGGCRCAPVH